MAVLSDLVSRVRLELGDMPKQFTSTFTGDGTTKDFDTKIKPLEDTTLVVTVNNVAQTQPQMYTVEKDLGVFHFVTAPTNNHVIKIVGTSYRYFTDADITRFINTAVEQHTHERTDTHVHTPTHKHSQARAPMNTDMQATLHMPGWQEPHAYVKLVA